MAASGITAAHYVPLSAFTEKNGRKCFEWRTEDNWQHLDKLNAVPSSFGKESKDDSVSYSLVFKAIVDNKEKDIAFQIMSPGLEAPFGISRGQQGNYGPSIAFTLANLDPNGAPKTTDKSSAEVILFTRFLMRVRKREVELCEQSKTWAKPVWPRYMDEETRQQVFVDDKLFKAKMLAPLIKISQKRPDDAPSFSPKVWTSRYSEKFGKDGKTFEFGTPDYIKHAEENGLDVNATERSITQFYESKEGKIVEAKMMDLENVGGNMRVCILFSSLMYSSGLSKASLVSNMTQVIVDSRRVRSQGCMFDALPSEDFNAAGESTPPPTQDYPEHLPFDAVESAIDKAMAERNKRNGGAMPDDTSFKRFQGEVNA